MTERNRACRTSFIARVDGLKGFPDAIEAAWLSGGGSQHVYMCATA